MKKLKELYSSPTTDFFEVRFEESILSNPDGYHKGGAGSYDEEDEEIIDNGEY